MKSDPDVCYLFGSSSVKDHTGMPIAERTVFLSYRRINSPWARAVYQDLTHHGFDVFMDYENLPSGDFRTVILENILARAHFVLVLTPLTLERCSDPEDLLRREIEWAIARRRNIVPLLIDGFKFDKEVAKQLTGGLANLAAYDGVGVYAEYFDAAMERLRNQKLNRALEAVSHPASSIAQEAANERKIAANQAPKVKKEELIAQRDLESENNMPKASREELSAQQYLQQGDEAISPAEKIRLYNLAVQLDPKLALAFFRRGLVRYTDNDMDGAMADYEEAIRLNPNDANFFGSRGVARRGKGDIDGAMADYEEAIRLNPNDDISFYNRGITKRTKGDIDGAIADLDAAIQLKPTKVNAFYNRGVARDAKGDVIGAIGDFQRYLDLGGGEVRGNTQNVRNIIADLKNKM